MYCIIYFPYHLRTIYCDILYCTVQLKYTDIWIGMGEMGKVRRGEMSGGGEGVEGRDRGKITEKGRGPRGRKRKGEVRRTE